MPRPAQHAETLGHGRRSGFFDPRQKLPEGFQRSDFLLRHGMLDAVVPRPQLKPFISRALDFFCGPVAA